MYKKVGYYRETDKMSDLICANYPMILVMGRFGIELGFEEKSIGDVCKMNSVDTNTFLAVVNLMLSDNKQSFANSVSDISIIEIMKYIKCSHGYFLEYKLPIIRKNLVEALDTGRENKLKDLIISYYDEYLNEVKNHMSYEESTVFGYVDKLLDKTLTDEYNIMIFSEVHEKIEEKLTEFRNIVIKYYSQSSSNQLNSVLFDILTCSDDLSEHSNVENFIFIPLIAQLEQQITRK